MTMDHHWPVRGAALVVAMATIPVSALAANPSLTTRLTAESMPTKIATSVIHSHPAISLVGSTVPATGTGKGDVNPYGIAVVPASSGHLKAGHVLVSNFNNVQNQAGTGTTIVDFAPGGKQTVFATINPAGLKAAKLNACPGGIGLTTGLSVLRSGWVIVGSLPTTGGNLPTTGFAPGTSGFGCLIVLNSSGKAVETIASKAIRGPWDLTTLEQKDNRVAVFVSNVLNGFANGMEADNRGSVVRITLDVHRGLKAPKVLSTHTIATGLAEKTDPAALVVGPTGLGISRNGTLYVADTVGSRVLAITKAASRMTVVKLGAKGTVVSSGGALNGPLGLAVAGNGNILTVNANDGNLVETTPSGHQIAVKALDTTGTPAGAGTLFGLALAPQGRGIYFDDDGTNTLNLLH